MVEENEFPTIRKAFGFFKIAPTFIGTIFLFQQV
jgi:hypothetical protein